MFDNIQVACFMFCTCSDSALTCSERSDSSLCPVLRQRLYVLLAFSMDHANNLYSYRLFRFSSLSQSRYLRSRRQQTLLHVRGKRAPHSERPETRQSRSSLQRTGRTRRLECKQRSELAGFICCCCTSLSASRSTASRLDIAMYERAFSELLSRGSVLQCNTALRCADTISSLPYTGP